MYEEFYSIPTRAKKISFFYTSNSAHSIFFSAWKFDGKLSDANFKLRGNKIETKIINKPNATSQIG
jgi:hypothetical protein